MTTSITSNASYSALTHNGVEVVKYDGSGLQADSIPDASIATQMKANLNATGDAPIYACRAWVSFNGTGTVSILGSGNVSSITDNGTGDYTVNFTTAMPDADYVAIANIPTVTSGAWDIVSVDTHTAGGCNVLTYYGGQTTSRTQKDSSEVCVAIFR